MKAFLLAPMLALSLSACAGLGALMSPPPPATVANQTILDEQGAMSVELAYKAARTAMEVAVDAGLLNGEKATTAAAIDNRAYAAVTGVRAAYRAGNAASYQSALGEARTLVSEMLTAVR